MIWLHLGVWPDNFRNFYIFLICPCRSLLVPLCLLPSLLSACGDSGPASCIVSVSESQLQAAVPMGRPAHGGTTLEESEWQGTSPHPIWIMKQRLARVISHSFLSFLFYVRGIHHSSPFAVTQGEMNQLPLFSHCPVLSGISDHTITSLSLWRWLGHLGAAGSTPQAIVVTACYWSSKLSR